MKQWNELHIAYLQTEYSIDFPAGRIWISHLSNNRELEQFLSRLKVSNWALITPHNPASRFLSESENEALLRDFEKELLNNGRIKDVDYFGSVSKPKDSEIMGEIGFWIANVYPWEAIRIGHRWGQNAILTGCEDGLAEVQWCSHESQIYFEESD
jgi:hypothetical protein